MEIFLFILFFALLLMGSQCVVILLLNCLEKYIEEDIKTFREKDNSKSDFDKEVGNYELLKKQNEIKQITKVVGVIEFIIFSALMFVSLTYYTGTIKIIETIGLAVLMWIGLKAVGSYSQWSGAILGRATFYNFLIGSIVNIALAIIVGGGFAIIIPI